MATLKAGSVKTASAKGAGTAKGKASGAVPQEKAAPGAGGAGKHKRRRRLDETRGGMDHAELLSAVCKYFCDGKTPSEIAEIMAEKHNILDMKREEPYQILARAAALRRLRFMAPTEIVLKERVREKCPWLDEVDIVHTGVFTPIADHVAAMLVRMLQRRAARGKDEVHVGLAGGHSMRKVCRAFAFLMSQRPPGMPKKLILHAMAAGFDVEDPMTAPTTFSAYFADDTGMPLADKFVGLYAPTLMDRDEIDKMKSLEGIEEALSQASQLDIVVTSASVWSDKHSLLRQHLESKSPGSLKALQDRGCIGDMFWRPLNKQGPIEVPEERMRTLSLMELGQFPEFIRKGGQVLLVLGPCGECHLPKGEMMEAVLTMNAKLITHLVADSRTTREVIERI